MRYFFYFCLVLLAFSLYWNQKFYFQNHKYAKELSKLRSDVNKLDHDLIDARSDRQSRIEAERQAIKTLDSQIQTKTLELASLSEKVKGINDVDLSGNNPSTLEWDIRHQKEIVADFERQIKDIKAQEDQINNQSKIVQNQDKWSKAESENALQSQIAYQEQNLRDLQGRLSQAKSNRASSDVIRKYQDQVNQQKDFLKGMKAQKQTLSRQWTQVSAQHASTGQLAQLKETEKELKDRLQNEKNTLIQLQGNLNSDRQLADQHKKQVSQNQKNYQDKKAEIDNLKSQKADYERRLAALTAQSP